MVCRNVSCRLQQRAHGQFGMATLRFSERPDVTEASSKRCNKLLGTFPIRAATSQSESNRIAAGQRMINAHSFLVCSFDELKLIEMLAIEI